MNHNAIDRGIQDVKEVTVPASWANAEGYRSERSCFRRQQKLIDFVNDIVIPVNNQLGDKLPVSTFTGDRADGTFPQGTAAYEKRGIAVDVPCWNPQNCIQCNFCSYVCPHACIRPYVLTEEEMKNAPKDMKFVPMTGMPGYYFAMTITVLDCTGCGSCANVCPGKKGEKALELKSLESQLSQQESFAYGFSLGKTGSQREIQRNNRKGKPVQTAVA